jgi:hypothetical protein
MMNNKLGWEFMKCGREEGDIGVDHLGVCPAYPNDGNRCATVVGTFCDLVQAMYAKKKPAAKIALSSTANTLTKRPKE